MKKVMVVALVIIFLFTISPFSITAELINIKSPRVVLKDLSSLIIKYKKPLGKRSLSFLSGKGLKVSSILPNDTYKISLKRGKNIESTLASVRQDPRVEYAEPNYIRQVFTSANDTYYASQWALSKVKAAQGWDYERGLSNQVMVAVVDSGVDLLHPDLIDKLVNGYDFTENDNSPYDDIGHGTHVAGIIAAQANNGLGIAGLSWGAKIMPVRVLSGGMGTDWTVAQGIYWAVDNGADIINLSLGGPGYSSTLADATNYAYNHGVLVLAAAGNDGDGTVEYPAGNEHVIGVGATDRNDDRANFSNYNASVDVSAPGVDVLSTYGYEGSAHDYAYMSGTSMATPMASGLAALIKSKYSDLNVDGLTNRLMERSDDLGSLGRDNYYGNGRINAYFALAGNITYAYVRTSRSVLTYSQRFSIAFTLRPRLVNALVYVRRKPFGAKKWGRYHAYRTNSQGILSLKGRPPQNSYYQFWFPGDGQNAPASKIIKVKVKPLATIKASVRQIPRGGSFVLAGTVKPRHSGSKVKIYVSVAGSRRWYPVAKVRLNRKSQFTYRFRSSVSGLYKFRFVIGAHKDHLAASSRTVSVLVR